MAVNVEVKREVKKIVDQLKTAQTRFQGMIKDKTWLEEARKYAEGQGKEIKKLLSSDLKKVKTFLDRERKELDRFQKQIPGELEKFRTYVGSQRKELERLLQKVKQAGTKTNGHAKSASSGTRKRKASGGARKKSSSKRSSSARA